MNKGKQRNKKGDVTISQNDDFSDVSSIKDWDGAIIVGKRVCPLALWLKHGLFDPAKESDWLIVGTPLTTNHECQNHCIDIIIQQFPLAQLLTNTVCSVSGSGVVLCWSWLLR
jgi:hypothetical protein